MRDKARPLWRKRILFRNLKSYRSAKARSSIFFSLSPTPFFCIQSIEPWSCIRVGELSVLEQKYISEQYCLEQHVAEIVGNPEISLWIFNYFKDFGCSLASRIQ